MDMENMLPVACFILQVMVRQVQLSHD